MKKVLVPGLVAAIGMIAAIMVLGYLSNLLFPSVKAEYESTTMFRPWSDPLMYLYFIQPFLLSISLTWGWDKIKNLFHGGLGRKAFNLTLVYMIMASLPGMLMTISSFQVSALMTLTWTISSFFQVWIAALIFIRMSK
jgi:hypothetical protein